jgi:hypothetical protein
MSKKGNERFYFEGFDSPNTTPVPDVFFDLLAPQCSEAELRVLIYIMRRTFGFKKNSDAISLSQMVDGITTRDGRVLDLGTGMSRRGVMKGCAGLVTKGVIEVRKRRADQGDSDINIYRLRFKNTAEIEIMGVGNDVPYGRERRAPRVGNEGAPQETGLQETDQQQTEIYSNEIESNFPTSKETYARLSTTLRARGTVDNGRAGDGGHTPSSEPAAHKRLRTVAQAVTAGQSLPAAPTGSKETRRGRPPKAPYIEATMIDFSSLVLNDPDHARANVTRAIRLWQASGMDEERFVQEVIYPARSLTQQAGDIKKRAGDGSGRRNKAPYFFAVVEDLLGLRPQGREA